MTDHSLFAHPCPRLLGLQNPPQQHCSAVPQGHQLPPRGILKSHCSRLYNYNSFPPLHHPLK